jgi:hypothetical protein
LTGEHIKVTPVYESNPIDSVENPTYCVSKVVGVIIEEVPQKPAEENPRYIASQEATPSGGGPRSNHNPSSEWLDSDATKSAVTKHLP